LIIPYVGRKCQVKIRKNLKKLDIPLFCAIMCVTLHMREVTYEFG